MNDLQEKAATFIGRLYGFAEQPDRAALAALRQGLDVDAGIPPAMHRYIVPILPEGLSEKSEEIFYLVAALFARWHQMASGPVQTVTGSLARSLRALSDRLMGGPHEVNSGVERDFNAMISTPDLESLRFRLRRIVTRLGREGIGVNWPQLLIDLHGWEHPDRLVQQKWARDFWRSSASVGNTADGLASD